MSKERLDKVIYKAERTALLTRPPKPLVTIPDEDFEWLVEHVKEQAEKFQELRKRYLILTKENNQVNDELIDEFRKNKRYRDLLKRIDRKSTRLNSSHVAISYAVFCLKKKKKQ